jgi:uncharacterized protein
VEYPDVAACASKAEASDMTDSPNPVGPIDLHALDEYLMSDRVPDDSMGLSALDGFLTGIVIGPELIRPSEWLPVIWGGETPELENKSETQTILGTIMGRYNEIVARINNDADEFDLVFEEGPEGEVIASEWADGLLAAVALRPKAWKALMDSHDGWKLMVPFLLLSGDLKAESAVADEHELLAEMPEMIPACIKGISKFWKSRKPMVVNVARSRR